MTSQKIKKIVFTLLPLLALVLYTNVSKIEDEPLTPEEILQSSLKMNKNINAPGRSENLKIQFKKAKIRILNYYAAKQDLRRCGQLLAADPTMLTGVYNLYPKGKLTAVLCEIENGRVKTSTVVSEFSDSQTQCHKKGTCVGPQTFYAEFNCASTSGSTKTYCPVKGVFGTPVLIEAANNQCHNGAYGFDQAGFWVKNGCSGKFAMNKVFSSSERMPLLTWPYRGDSFQYQLDVRHIENGQNLTKESCVNIKKMTHLEHYNDARQGNARHEFIFSGLCDDNTSINFSETVSVRLCFTPDMNGSKILCTPYLKTDQGFANFNVPAAGDIGSIRGFVDSATVEGSNLVVRGWTCHIGDPRPIQVHMYHRNQAGQTGNQWLGHGWANVTHADEGISMICLSGGTAHRYEVQFPLQAKNIPTGSPIYAYGISLIAGKGNTLLNQSGMIKVPYYEGSPPLCLPPTNRCDPFNEYTRRNRDHLGCEFITCQAIRRGSDR